MPQVNNIDSVLRNVLKIGQCWVWQGTVAENGYGKVTVNYKTLSTHKYVYQQLVCDVPEGLQLDHLCNNKLCVNPEHLEPVTCLENMRRRYELINNCKQEHSLSGDNLYITPDGRRQCRSCRRVASAKFKYGA